MISLVVATTHKSSTKHTITVKKKKSIKMDDSRMRLCEIPQGDSASPCHIIPGNNCIPKDHLIIPNNFICKLIKNLHGDIIGCELRCKTPMC